MSTLEIPTVLGSVAAFLFSALKYIDTRKFESKTKRFEQFRLVCGWLAGRSEAGVVLVNVQQAIAVYQLGEFPEYREISLPIMNYYLEQMANEPPTDVFKSALLGVRTKLSLKEGQNRT